MRLRLTSADFYALTPAMFAELQRQWLAEQRVQQAMLARLRADIINFSMRGPEEPIRPDQLLPRETAQSSARARGVARRRREIADSVRRLFGVPSATGS